MTTDNLPRPTMPFIGRDNEINQVIQLLNTPECRLLTLTGPGGIGKTRLAIEVARSMLGGSTEKALLRSTTFSHGGSFVSLQSLTSSDFIVQTIADALKFTLTSSLDPQQQLLGFLREKHMLLVLDNFEHVMDGAALLPKILEHAPRLKLLVTSRERLRLREEWLFDVGGLSYPVDQPIAGWDDFAAVQLFVQGARRAGYTPVDEDAAAIARICQALQGIPLAVDLAAAWVRIMSCDDIALEVQYGLDILTTTARNMPEKHRSMQAAIEYSWELLTAEEQAVCRKLSVFRGGFTREGASRVAGATLTNLAALVDKSLVQVHTKGRYDLHELLRQYAADKLLDAKEVSDTIRQHVEYFLHLAEGAEVHNFGREQITWFDQMEVEFGNLRAALVRSIETETGMQIAASLGWFFGERGYWSEGLDWLDRALQANPNVPVSLRAKALHTAGALAGFLGNPRARTLCEEALNLARATDDRWNIAWALCQLAVWETTDQSVAQLEESLKLFRELDDVMGLTHTLVRRSWLAREQGDYVYTRKLLEEAAHYTREAGDIVILAWVSYDFGKLAWHQDQNLKLARTHFQNSLSLFQETRLNIGLINTLLTLAQLDLMIGNPKQAQKHSQEALNLLWERSPESAFVSGTLLVLASIAKVCGQVERATVLLAAANSGHWDDPRVFDSEIDFDSVRTEVRTQLGYAAFAKSWADGEAMTREQAVTYALEGATFDAEQTATSNELSRATQTLTNPLSPREMEVLVLIADGLTNREIATRLFIGVSTVKKHIQHIYEKLYTKNRTSTVVRARELNLLQ